MSAREKNQRTSGQQQLFIFILSLLPFPLSPLSSPSPIPSLISQLERPGHDGGTRLRQRGRARRRSGQATAAGDACGGGTRSRRRTRARPRPGHGGGAMPLESVSDIDAVLQRAAEADQLAEAASVSSDSDLVIDV